MSELEMFLAHKSHKEAIQPMLCQMDESDSLFRVQANRLMPVDMTWNYQDPERGEPYNSTNKCWLCMFYFHRFLEMYRPSKEQLRLEFLYQSQTLQTSQYLPLRP